MAISISELLLDKFLEWQSKSGERKTLKQFAEYIGIGNVFLNQLINKRRSAGEKTIAHLSSFFQDQRFYDAVNLPRPDPDLELVISKWGMLPEKAKKHIREEVIKYDPQ